MLSGGKFILASASARVITSRAGGRAPKRCWSRVVPKFNLGDSEFDGRGASAGTSLNIKVRTPKGSVPIGPTTFHLVRYQDTTYSCRHPKDVQYSSPSPMAVCDYVSVDHLVIRLSLSTFSLSMHVPTSSIGTVCNLPVSPSLPAPGYRFREKESKVGMQPVG
ncbi:uncharacterized protein CCOS01_01780 [Colletotrichum costaricense]|uniref:Uncharacterized protein n=1 Tax=Colletotrichum costaricense TaxID=1209916 RepID=A0AAI9Z6P4_9PEZI|nr:uncharacterized protein CCOS01_01780 [Colletotrichum costaricense]KAK1536460.1 hypothetical protein CCOS01_01780 [Colletotrichum costaricense]